MEESDKRTDLELVAAANNGDRSAFETLYYRYRNWVFSIANKICENEQDACDVLQDVFFYFFNKFPGFELRSQIKTFLYPAVRNNSLNRIKKSKRTGPLPENNEELPAEPVRNEETERKELLESIQSLSTKQQDLLMLRFADNLSLQEIAETLSVPTGTVKSRLHKALKTLKKHLK